jgi:putative acetyltransferase
MATAPVAVQLRRARPSDAEDLAALMNDPAVYPGVLQLPFTGEDHWRKRLDEPGGAATADLHLVAVVDGRVVASAGVFAATPPVRRRHAMSLGIAIAGDWQGRGIGDQLMTALLRHADRWLGVLRLELTVWSDNARAIALYRRHGFEVEGTHRAYALRDGAYVDAIAMARLHPSPPQLPGPREA